MKCVIDMPYWDASDACDKVAEAEIIDVAPHLASIATFAIHKHPRFHGLWRVSNVETGRFIYIRYDDESDKTRCIKSARANLAQRTIAFMEQAYINYRKDHPQ